MANVTVGNVRVVIRLLNPVLSRQIEDEEIEDFIKSIDTRGLSADTVAGMLMSERNKKKEITIDMTDEKWLEKLTILQYCNLLRNDIMSMELQLTLMTSVSYLPVDSEELAKRIADKKAEMATFLSLAQAPNATLFIDSYGTEVTPGSSIIIEKHYSFDYLCGKAKVIWNPAQGMYMFMPENSRGVHDFQGVALFKVIK